MTSPVIAAPYAVIVSEGMERTSAMRRTTTIRSAFAAIDRCATVRAGLEKENR